MQQTVSRRHCCVVPSSDKLGRVCQLSDDGRQTKPHSGKKRSLVCLLGCKEEPTEGDASLVGSSNYNSWVIVIQ